MKLCFDGIAIRQSPSNRNTNKRLRINSLCVCTLLILIGSIAIFWGIKDVNAQSSSSFKIVVLVQNTGNLDEHGALHVAIDGSRNPQTLSGIIFPGLQTSSFTFEFPSAEVPVGKGFTAEVIYGDDDIKRVSGANSVANAPETVTLLIP
ncbi:MAG: hypothetical protein L0H53_04535 [Candidatus Nitrosocosmicus sp.]|nr:hypothetical protein [Candidatus Nitrosocosmicus sp.]MDN5868380.1 hypothetical protein [Candidatus Nitrosocosmicus sp.]